MHHIAPIIYWFYWKVRMSDDRAFRRRSFSLGIYLWNRIIVVYHYIIGGLQIYFIDAFKKARLTWIYFGLSFLLFICLDSILKVLLNLFFVRLLELF